jgi:hypothetical protein
MTEQSKYQLLSPVSAGESEDLLAGKPSEDALRRIQALLADWLRMENVIVLTAAGCSVGAGGRLMAGPRTNNLECLVLDAVEKCELPPKAASIMRHRKATWPTEENGGPLGFEDWLSYLFNASGLTNPDSSPVDANCVNWLRRPSSLNVPSRLIVVNSRVRATVSHRAIFPFSRS